MSPADHVSDPPRAARRATLRKVALYGGFVQVAFWVFFHFYIRANANPLGDGLEWIAIVPATGILLAFVAPALVLAVIGRLIVVAAGLAIVGALLNAVLFVQIAGEFAR